MTTRCLPRCPGRPRGYLLKDADQAEIVRAVRAVASGEAIFGPAIAARMLGYFAARQARLRDPGFPADRAGA